jgi:hypothetical protein
MEHHIDINNSIAPTLLTDIPLTTTPRISRNLCLSVVSIFKIIWIIMCCYLLISKHIHNMDKLLVIGIMGASLGSIYIIFHKQRFGDNYVQCNFYTIIYILCVLLVNANFCIFFYFFIFSHETITNVAVNKFFWVYFFFEYILYVVSLFVVYLIIYCQCRIFYPMLFIQIANNIAIQTGANETELENLNYCKFQNGSIVCSDDGPMPNENFDETNCAICMEDYFENDDIIILPCQHHYHKKCGIDWFKINKTCPICRTGI